MVMLDRKVLIFDLGGVLLNIAPRSSADAFEAMGVDKRFITDGLNLINPVLRGLECGTVSPEELYCAVADAIGVECTPELAHKIKEAWCGMLCDVPVEKLRRLRSLRAEGYKVLLLSNTNAIHWDVITKIMEAVEGRPMSDYFDALYLSFEMGCCKPDVEIFEKLLRSEGVAAADCIFFDDLRANCEAALALGIQAQLMERNAPWPEWLA